MRDYIGDQDGGVARKAMEVRQAERVRRIDSAFVRHTGVTLQECNIPIDEAESLLNTISFFDTDGENDPDFGGGCEGYPWDNCGDAKTDFMNLLATIRSRAALEEVKFDARLTEWRDWYDNPESNKNNP